MGLRGDIKKDLTLSILETLDNEFKEARAAYESYYLQTRDNSAASEKALINAKVKASEQILQELKTLNFKIKSNTATPKDCLEFQNFLRNQLRLIEDMQDFPKKYHRLEIAVASISNELHKINNEKLKARLQSVRNERRQEEEKLQRRIGVYNLPEPKLSTPELTRLIRELYKNWRENKNKFQQSLLQLDDSKQEVLDHILYDAVLIGDSDTVRELIDLNANVRYLPYTNQTCIVEDMLGLTAFFAQPLTHAQRDIIQFLIKAGANINQTIQQQNSPPQSLLSTASQFGCDDLIKLLIEAGVEITDDEKQNISPPLVDAHHHLQQAFAILTQYDKRYNETAALDHEKEMNRLYEELNKSFQIEADIFNERLMMIARGDIENSFQSPALHLLLSCLLFLGPPLPEQTLLTLGEKLLTDNNPFGRLFLIKAQAQSHNSNQDAGTDHLLRFHNYKLLADQALKAIIQNHIPKNLQRDIDLYDWFLTEIFRDPEHFYSAKLDTAVSRVTKIYKCPQTHTYYALGRALEDIALVPGTDESDRKSQLRNASYCFIRAANYRDARTRFWRSMEKDKPRFEGMAAHRCRTFSNNVRHNTAQDSEVAPTKNNEKAPGA